MDLYGGGVIPLGGAVAHPAYKDRASRYGLDAMWQLPATGRDFVESDVVSSAGAKSMDAPLAPISWVNSVVRGRRCNTSPAGRCR